MRLTGALGWAVVLAPLWIPALVYFAMRLVHAIITPHKPHKG